MNVGDIFYKVGRYIVSTSERSVERGEPGT